MVSVILVMSVVSFMVMGYDKFQAVTGGRRIKNIHNYLITISFGSLGTILAMVIFKHKIRCNDYIAAVITGLIVNSIITGYFWYLIWYSELLIAIILITILCYVPVCNLIRNEPQTFYPDLSDLIKNQAIRNDSRKSLLLTDD